MNTQIITSLTNYKFYEKFYPGLSRVNQTGKSSRFFYCLHVDDWIFKSEKKSH